MKIHAFIKNLFAKSSKDIPDTDGAQVGYPSTIVSSGVANISTTDPAAEAFNQVKKKNWKLMSKQFEHDNASYHVTMSIMDWYGANGVNRMDRPA